MQTAVKELHTAAPLKLTVRRMGHFLFGVKSETHQTDIQNLFGKISTIFSSQLC